MRDFLFIIFIIAAAAVDRSPSAGFVCVGALVILYLLDRKEEGRLCTTRYALTVRHAWIRANHVTADRKVRHHNRTVVIITIKRRRNMMNEIKITIEGLNELTEAVRALAGMPGGQQTPAQVPAAAPVIPAGYGQAPVQTPAPMGQSVPPAGTIPAVPPAGTVPTMPVPTTAMPQEYTIEQLQVAAAGLSSMGKMPQLRGILQQFGIQAMTELPRERYGEFASALREAGAQI